MDKIKNEYIYVCKNTSNFVQLKRAHNDKISIDTFFYYLKKLCKKHNISWKKGVFIFCKDIIRRSEGGVILRKGKYVPYLLLCYEDLTVGILLHEFSHIIEMRKSLKYKKHGKSFIKTFDKLISNYYSSYYV